MKPSVFRPFGQFPSQTSMAVVLFTAVDPEALVAPARQIIAQLDPDLPMFGVRTMAAQMQHSLWERRAYSWLFAAFAAVAILLAAAGIYGVISFGVSRRTREIGIRMALGAQARAVQRLILRQGLILTCIALALGWPAAWMLAKFASSFLYGIQPHDTLTFTLIPPFLTIVALFACWLPARRAAMVDPVQALRAD
jgi:ABC-type lipoprotein release transport system permease subunit